MLHFYLILHKISKFLLNVFERTVWLVYTLDNLHAEIFMLGRLRLISFSETMNLFDTQD